ncbi:MAG: DUF6249 domain-containing protein [Candidatus Eisenbacteria bacterium]
MFFGFMTALISIGAGVLMVMLIMKGINRSQELRQQMYMKTLEKGVYDYRLIGGARKSSGTAVLGWGILFTAVGIALFFSFISLGILDEAMAGALVPMFVGIALIVYYSIRRKIVGDEKQNGEPVTFSPPTGGSDGSVRIVAGDDE